jgi:hypothetical protein
MDVGIEEVGSVVLLIPDFKKKDIRFFSKGNQKFV